MKSFQMAWRNLWRSKSRTLLTASIVFIIVILSTAMSSQQYGMYDKMIENLIEMSGHLQIQDTAYVDKKTINHSLEIEQDLLVKIENTEHVKHVVPRISSFSLASFNDMTKGVAVLGIDPVKENNLAKLENKLVKFKISPNIQLPEQDSLIQEQIAGKSFLSEESITDFLTKLYPENESKVNEIISNSKFPSAYLTKGDKGVLIGERLAKYLKATVGDTLAFISQGYHGISAADLFVVRGLVKLPLADFERRIAFIDIQTCQQFYSLDNMYTSLSIIVDRDNNKNKVKNALSEILPDKFIVETWEESQPEMVQMIESDKAGGVFMKGIFYMIVGFIIFGTIVMMMIERKREFGIIVSVGMQKSKLLAMLFFETLYVSLLGTLVGLGLSIPIVNFMHHNPIPLQGEMAQMMEDYGFEAVIYFSNSPEMFYRQALVIFIMAMTVYIYPIFKVIKLNPIKAIRG